MADTPIIVPEKHTRQCKHCGEINDVGNAICRNCLTPLSAYGGQVGQEENYAGKLAAKVDALDTRPPIVTVMTVFNVLFALFVPVWTVIAAWSSRAHLNADGTNGIQAAVGVVGPIIQTLVLVPIAVVLWVVAYFTWTQRNWAWTANVAVLVVIAALSLCLRGFAPMTFFWMAAAGIVAYFWYQPAVKAWLAADERSIKH